MDAFSRQRHGAGVLAIEMMARWQLRKDLFYLGSQRRILGNPWNVLLRIVEHTQRSGQKLGKIRGFLGLSQFHRRRWGHDRILTPMAAIYTCAHYTIQSV